MFQYGNSELILRIFDDIYGAMLVIVSPGFLKLGSTGPIENPKEGHFWYHIIKIFAHNGSLKLFLLRHSLKKRDNAKMAWSGKNTATRFTKIKKGWLWHTEMIKRWNSRKFMIHDIRTCWSQITKIKKHPWFHARTPYCPCFKHKNFEYKTTKNIVFHLMLNLIYTFKLNNPSSIWIIFQITSVC